MATASGADRLYWAVLLVCLWGAFLNRATGQPVTSRAIQEALAPTEFRDWRLEWVTETDFSGFRYTVFYGQKNPKSAIILLRTDLSSWEVILIKNDTSLFPFNERSANTPPEEVRLALAEGEMRRQAQKYGSWRAYVEALRRANLIGYLSKEQREILRRNGFN
jgi:hypothetical protein